MNNGYFPSYFNPHGLGAPPGTPHAPVLDPALSSWTANPHLAAAAMAAAAAEQLRNNSAVAAAAHAAHTGAAGPQPPLPSPQHHHHHPNPVIPQGVGGGGGFHHPFPYPTSSYGGSSLGSSSVSGPISTSITSRLLAEEKTVDKRPPIISKPGNVSTSPSISSWSSRISDTATSHMFNTGLPPLDRQGLFPSHGSILDPLQTASFSNNKGRSSSSTTLVPAAPQTDSFRPKENAKTVVPSATAAHQPPSVAHPPPVAPPPTVTHAPCVNLASESDEEVLVDDFDGQCCRTYPENHSRIIKWRSQRAEKLRLQQASHPPTSAQQKQDSQPPLPPPSSSSSRTTCSSSTTTSAVVKPMSSSLVPRKSQDGGKSSSVPTTSGSSIPVGIAIGRQRQPGGLNTQPPWKPLASPTSAGTSTIPPPLGSLGAPPPGSSSSGTPALVPPTTPSLHHQGLHHNPWLPPHHLQPSPAGPIPMGYQLAKDPLTGQILLIPTDPTQPTSHHGSSWPHIPGPYGAVDRTPPGVLQSHYHHLYMQQQQLRYYQELHQGAADHHALSRLQHLQRQDLLRGPASPASCSSIASRRPLFDRNKEPETITVSDDDDEVSKPAAGDVATGTTLVPTTKTSTASTNIIPSASSSSKDKIVQAHTAVNLAKPISTTTTSSQNIIPEEKSVKTHEEVDKIESKQIPDNVTNAQLPAVSNIKQEPGVLNEIEEHTEPDTELKLIAESLLELSCTTSSSWNIQHQAEHKATSVSAPEAPLDIIGDNNNDFHEENEAKTFNFYHPEHDVFGALLKGIELHEQSKDGIDMLCAVTHQEAHTQKISYNSSHLILNSRFDVLCCVTKRDKIVIDEYIDPLILLKQQINLRDHQTSAETIQSFIQTKAQYYKRLQEQGSSESYDQHYGNYGGDGSDLARPSEDICPSLTKMIKKIKNTEFMSDLEIELRNQLIQLQEDYKEKQSQLSRFKSPRKKYQKKLKKIGKIRSSPSKVFSTPSPAKSRFIASKQQKERRHSSSPALSNLSSITAGTSGTTNPPRLEPNSSPPRLHNSAAESWKQSSALLKPPKLTASLAHHPQRNSGNRGGGNGNSDITSLSDIKSRFMKGKANPFANLISKLATTTTSTSGSTSPVKGSMPDIDEENEENTAESSENNIATAATSAANTTTDTDIDKDDDEDDEMEESVTESDSDLEDEYEFNVKKALKLSARGHHPFGSKRGRSSSMEDSSSSKKRKADKPKKQSSTISETIVPKKPKNLFMMNCYEFESGFMSQEEKEISTTAAAGSASTSNLASAASAPSSSSSSGANNLTTPTKKSTQSPAKSKKSTKVDLHYKGAKDNLRDAKLMETDLSDGLKLLILQEGRFWPARLNSTQLPDVYGIVMEKQRGNRPQILPRDDILKEAIFEVKPENKRQIPIGTRVCVYWSRAYNCLFPGTIEELEDVVLDRDNMVQVLLDDGDRRQVDVGSVRMLPQDCAHIDYDPDPIATLRKRRISADSLDSGSGSHRETMHSLMSNQLMLSPLAKSESSKLANRNKPDKHKHKKKKKHHHCKRKHKRSDKHEDGEDEDEDDDDDFEDDTLKIKLDGSFNNTTTYSIRSPMYHNRSEESNHEEEEDPENHYNNDETTSADDSTSSDDDDENNSEKKPSKKLNRGINPVTGRPLWNWADEGYRRPGSKGKAKKLFHRSVSRDNETINVGDCAVFLSTARVDRPYIGQVELLWETWNGNMMVKVKWFYHPEEIEISTADSVDLRVPGGLFQSPHTDENDVQTISHKCSVLPLKEYSKMMISDPVKRKKIYTSSDTYYLAGSYDPTAMTVNFQPGVLRH